MATFRTSTLVLCVAVFSACAIARNDSVYTNGVSGDAPAVFLDDEATFGVCVYPASGTYSFLNRMLYYCTLIFSLFSRAHLWLVAGALAAALTYSGAAAVHACLLVWRGPNPYIEQDSWVLYSVLSSACLITVPLLNWSGTLRRLGAKASSIKDAGRMNTQSDISTRTIVVYWAFLVLVGFLCIWLQVQYGADETNMEYPIMNKVMCNPGTNGSMLMSPNGTFHRRAIDPQFVQGNGCVDPCSQINIPSLFRQQGDLILMNHQQALLWNSSLPSLNYEWAEEILQIEDKLFNVDFYILPFILVQGIIAALFGRRDPREIRDLIYIQLFMKRPLTPHPSPLLKAQDYATRSLAAFNYILAAATVLLCPPLFIIQLISSELQFWNLSPDAEAPYNVGQWSSWAITVQIILAAIIARYHDRLIHTISQTYRHFFPSSRTKHGYATYTAGDEIGNLNPNANKPDLPPSTEYRRSSDPSSPHAPTTTTTTKSIPLIQRLRKSWVNAYHMLSHPLNQSDLGLFDEIRNFIQWCKDPRMVSRLVVRNPLRPRDLRGKEAEGGLEFVGEGGLEGLRGVEVKGEGYGEREGYEVRGGYVRSSLAESEWGSPELGREKGRGEDVERGA